MTLYLFPESHHKAKYYAKELITRTHMHCLIVSRRNYTINSSNTELVVMKVKVTKQQDQIFILISHYPNCVNFLMYGTF